MCVCSGRETWSSSSCWACQTRSRRLLCDVMHRHRDIRLQSPQLDGGTVSSISRRENDLSRRRPSTHIRQVDYAPASESLHGRSIHLSTEWWLWRTGDLGIHARDNNLLLSITSHLPTRFTATADKSHSSENRTGRIGGEIGRLTRVTRADRRKTNCTAVSMNENSRRRLRQAAFLWSILP